MPGPTRSTAASSAARASAPVSHPSVSKLHATFTAAWGVMSGPTRSTATSSAARASAPGSHLSVAKLHTVFDTS